MQVEHDQRPALQPWGSQIADGLGLRVDAGVHVVAVVVTRAAVLALVAIFDAIFVYKRDDAAVDVTAKPAADRVVGQTRPDQAFQGVAGHHFTTVVPCGDQQAAWGIGVAQPQLLHRPTFEALAERFAGEGDGRAKLLQEEIQMLLCIGHAHPKAHVVGVGREGVSEGRGGCVLDPSQFQVMPASRETAGPRTPMGS